MLTGQFEFVIAILTLNLVFYQPAAFMSIIGIWNSVNPIGRGLWMLLEWGGVNQPLPSRSSQNTLKKNHFFDFLKVHK